MNDFDVVIVGARCAGASLATYLAREGVRVAVIEKAAVPSDTLSSHMFQAPGINALRRLGVLDAALAAGAQPAKKADFRRGDFRVLTDFPSQPGDVGGLMSIRRHLLDELLAGAAQDAGAELLAETSVTGLERRDGRVRGVRVKTGGGAERTITARLVVGADGRSSTVATLAGSRKYHVVPSERLAYWAFFEGANLPPEPTAVYHLWDGRGVIATPSDSGLYQAIAIPDNSFLPEFKADREQATLDHLRACEPVAEIIEGATRVGKLPGILRFESFMREPAGDGWVLVGDAGHFKDPTPGQGMSDAFRHAAALAPAIVRGLTGSDHTLDAATATWGRWREDDAFEHHWLCIDTGEAGPGALAIPEMLRRAERGGYLDDYLNMFQHRAVPSKVTTPGRLISATVALGRRRGADRRQLARDFRRLVGTELGRQKLRRSPVYVDPAASAASRAAQPAAQPVGA